MLVVSLTSIPPRFANLPRVVAALLTQTRPPDRILLILPRRYRRFPGRHARPALPAAVEVIETDADLGPAGKALPAARALEGQDCDLLYCDDDWDYAPGWAEAFLSARAQRGPNTIIAASGFDVARLGLPMSPLQPRGCGQRAGYLDIAQGFSGVLTRPEHLAHVPHPPEEAWAVDDIWLSGHYARQGLPIWQAAGTRALCSPLSDPGALQDTALMGLNRDQANRACAADLVQRFGIWS